MDAETIRYLVDSVSQQLDSIKDDIKIEIRELRADIKSLEMKHADKIDELNQFKWKVYGVVAVIVFVLETAAQLIKN